ncbi:hypothetical protein BU25DRAFT_71699 [Macroventuria anomochaeta]|uniref:Uncharacterized protein n=1 Tax=Macroventuria anomochaeta TaxID=301207 RepID=A0ACB6RXL5_9PLEO|nr:uncharacterized protein BU25DRAFT_71699 [Macroventuria anomochaeta]KAF2626765.1 hypothetical protein BU25DRAFT_71699 [Macroventuria anomochaeta]
MPQSAFEHGGSGKENLLATYSELPILDAKLNSPSSTTADTTRTFLPLSPMSSPHRRKVADPSSASTGCRESMFNGSAAAPKTRPRSAAGTPMYREAAANSITEHRIRGYRSSNSRKTVYIGPSIAGCGKNGLMLGSSKMGRPE